MKTVTAPAPPHITAASIAKSSQIINFIQQPYHNPRQIKGANQSVYPHVELPFSLPFGILAITLPCGIFYARGMRTASRMRHEGKHWSDMWRLWCIGFYALYLYEYMQNRLEGMSHWKAYRNISFEVSARSHE